MNKIKYIFIIIILFVTTLFIYKINFSKNVDYNDFINISSLSSKFMDEYYSGVKELNENNNMENVIIVTSLEFPDSYGASSIVTSPNNQYFLQYDTSVEKENALELLKNDENVLYATENIMYDVFGTFNSWGIEKMGLDNAIDVSNNNDLTPITVAIIDTGCDVTALNYFYPGKIASSYNTSDGSSDVTDLSGHGTHVSGIIAEATSSNVKILPIKASSASDPNKLSTTDIITAINYVTYNKLADVINMSFGTDSFDMNMKVAITAANNNNIISVAAAGNDSSSTLMYPAAYNNTISVSSVDSNLDFSSFSNYGSAITFSSPGEDILSINGYASGTSMASPHVSSAVAILKSYYKDYTFDEVVHELAKYALDLGDEGWDEMYGYGFVYFDVDFLCDVGSGCIYTDKNESSNVVKIEESSSFKTINNYGSISNILNARIKVYYDSDNYYIKSLWELDDAQISNYNPFSYTTQEVTIKYKDKQTTINVDNSSAINLSFEYEVIDEELKQIKITNYLNYGNLSDVTRKLYIPSEIDSYTVVSLGDNLLSENTSLILTIIPDTVNEIGKRAFFNTKTDIDISSDAIDVGEYAFYGNDKIKKIQSKIKTLGEYSFAFCTNLETVVFANDLYAIPNNAFDGCTSFMEITLPNNLSSIGDNSFLDIDNNVIFWIYRDSYSELYVKNKGYNYLYRDDNIYDIEVVVSNNSYNAFDVVSLDDLEVSVIYNRDSLVKTIYDGEIGIDYENGDSFRYGDNYYSLYVMDQDRKLSKNIDVTVSKAIYNYMIPSDLTTIVGSPLSSIVLPSGFEWIDEDIIADEKGNTSFKARYVPEDIYNYEIVDDIDIPVNVTDSIKIISPDIIIQDKTYDGSCDIDLSTISVSNMEVDDYTVVSASTSLIDVGIGEVKVKLKIVDSINKNIIFENDKDEEEFTTNVKIIPKKVSKPVLVDKTYIYNGEEQFADIDNFDSDIMEKQGGSGINAGTYSILISLKSINYTWSDDSNDDVILLFNIDKKDMEFVDNSKDVTIKFDDNYHSIINDIEYDNGTILYMDENEEYTKEDIPIYKEVGTYVIKYKLYISDNYNSYTSFRTLKILPSNVINNSKDYEGMYDSQWHTISIDINVDEYKIKYSINNYDYDLEKIPDFMEPGEYTVNYKIDFDLYDSITSSNKVIIYGIKKFNDITVKENTLLISSNSFNTLSSNILTYSKESQYTHLQSNGEISLDDTLKTGDYVSVSLNNSVDYKYQISVSGDINGDGIINSADLLKIRQYLLGVSNLTNVYYFAADINGDNFINSADLLRVRQHLLSIKSIW